MLIYIGYRPEKLEDIRPLKGILIEVYEIGNGWDQAYEEKQDNWQIQMGSIKSQVLFFQEANNPACYNKEK